MLATEIVSEFVYDFPEADRNNMFSGHTILVLVPHQDDEACIMGGVLEEYVQYGSTVYVAFTTNGDYLTPDDTPVRAKETLDALAACGIPSNQAYFLGFGDQWKNEFIYHAKGDKVLTSHAGKTKTYGSDELHTVYREGIDYTRNNLKSSIRSLIEELRPDTIFCIDYDGHKDHRALSLLFEEVMGEMLKDDSTYTPFVFKGFGYSLSWHGVQDFYEQNMKSTVLDSDTDYMIENNYYNWSDRVRFPVSKGSLSRLKASSSLYKMLTCYPSQKATKQAGGIINGDRVFWYRDTASLLYQANIEATSGDPSLLNDFRIIDSKDITKVEQVFSGHVWIPSAKDTRKTITVTFAKGTDLSELRFYDNPDLTENILNLLITFSDGSTIESGPLQPNGAATSCIFDRKENISWFTVAVKSSEGSKAGLCEMEAYRENRSNGVSMIKLMNTQEDFVYDYWIDETGEEEFCIYQYPFVQAGDYSEHYTLEYNETENCSAYFENNSIIIRCGQGCSFELTVRSVEDPSLYDSVKISNPSHARRLLLKLLQHLEHASGI